MTGTNNGLLLHTVCPWRSKVRRRLYQAPGTRFVTDNGRFFIPLQKKGRVKQNKAHLLLKTTVKAD
jgi:hypothetical protein